MFYYMYNDCNHGVFITLYLSGCLIKLAPNTTTYIPNFFLLSPVSPPHYGPCKRSALVAWGQMHLMHVLEMQRGIDKRSQQLCWEGEGLSWDGYTFSVQSSCRQQYNRTIDYFMCSSMNEKI